jgi:hypothetical protein
LDASGSSSAPLVEGWAAAERVEEWRRPRNRPRPLGGVESGGTRCREEIRRACPLHHTCGRPWPVAASEDGEPAGSRGWEVTDGAPSGSSGWEVRDGAPPGSHACR